MQAKNSHPVKRVFAIFITLLMVLFVFPTRPQAQKFKVLHTFKGTDGASPEFEIVP
jgi:hypothetical protein